MLRRDFIRSTSVQACSLLGLGVIGCGRLEDSTLVSRLNMIKIQEIWSYYAPFSSYDGIVEEFQGRNSLDRRVIYEDLIKKTNRVNGKKSDGTDNRAHLDIEALEGSNEDYLRVKFWHDDNGSDKGHTLYIFKRHLEILEAGEKLFVATGMHANHFHIVMIEPLMK